MKRCCYGFIAILVLVASTFAQTFRGGIEGTVTDASGAAVTQGNVTVKDVGTGLERNTTTDSEGNYLFSELPLGTYQITATKQGFRSATVNYVQVGVSARERVNISLQPGDVRETVQVNEELPIVETTTDNMGGTLEAAQVEQLPVNGRDFSKVLTMVPGATADPGAVSESPGSFGLFSINGNRGRSNNYLLDGTDMNDGFRNDPAINEGGVFGVPATVLPLDAVAEFAILSGTEAEYGRNSGAIVNIVTKSGTNTLHGSGFEYFRNNHLDARNYFNTTDQRQDLFLNNQFGATLGGPIIKDRTFWFVAYEGQRERVDVPAILSVPTQAMVAGNTPAGGINPVIAALLARGPWTKGGPLPPGTDAFTPATIQSSNKGTNRLDSIIGKIDQHVGKNDLLTARYFFGDSSQNFPLGLQQGSEVPGYNTITPTRVQVVSLSYTHVFTQKLLMEVRGGWNRFAERFTPEDSSFNPNSIGLATVPPDQPLLFGLPQINVAGGLSSLGNGGSQPRGRFDTNWQYFTNFSYNTGKHNFKAGVEFRRTSINGFLDTHFRGRLDFSCDLTVTPALPCTGQPAPDFAAFLAGTPTGGTQSFGDTHRVSHQNNYGLYFQDNWRLTHKLTMNYGLRWDYFGIIHEIHNRFSIFDPATGQLVQVGSPGLSELYPKDLNNVSPRVSFAYDVFGTAKTVLRAGWGLYYDAFSQDFFLDQAPYNCGFCPGPTYNAIGPSIIASAGSITSPLQTGVPVFSSFSPSNEVFSVDQRLRTPYVQVYNLNVQQQLAPRIALQVGYVGSSGRKLFRYRDINQFDPTLGSVPYPAFSYINQFESTSTSSYNSLQAILTLRAFHGLTSSFNYTWSHSLDNASDGFDFVPQAAQPDNSYNPKAEWGNSNFDVRNRVSWNWHYEFPNGGSRFSKGWSLDGVVTLASGTPFDPTYYFEGDYNGSGEFFGRMDLVGNPFAGTSAPFNLLNLSAFQVPCNYDPNTSSGCSAANPNQHFGNTRRNSFIGPHYRNFDFSVAKSTQLSERLNLQLRADLFNVLNHPNFSNPVLPCYCIDMGVNGFDATGHGKEFLSTLATPDVGSVNPFLGGGGPRDIQLGIRLTF